MLSIIPADSVLAVAIKDATVTTSTVNPARITMAVQKMQPVSLAGVSFRMCRVLGKYRSTKSNVCSDTYQYEYYSVHQLNSNT